MKSRAPLILAAVICGSAALAVHSDRDRSERSAMVRPEVTGSVQAKGLRCGGDTVAGVPYRFCELSPAQVDLRIYWKDGNGRRIGSIAGLERMLGARGERLLFAMNGGMYEDTPESTPVGLYVQGGRELVRLDTRDGCCNFYHKPNGVFYVARGRAAVVETREYQRSRVRPDLATQSGPLLVRRGQFPHTDYSAQGPTNVSRNAVGVRPDGTVVFVMADGPTNMHALRLALRDHFGLRDALYLDGYVSRFYVAPGRPPVDSEFGAILAVVRRGTP
jgi:uncharacterized protein YigE (DUF2233 family)